MQSPFIAPSAPAPALKPVERAEKYLTLMSGKEEFGVTVVNAWKMDTSALGTPATTNHILGIAMINGKVKILLDSNEVPTSQKLRVLEVVIR